MQEVRYVTWDKNPAMNKLAQELNFSQPTAIEMWEFENFTEENRKEILNKNTEKLRQLSQYVFDFFNLFMKKMDQS